MPLKHLRLVNFSRFRDFETDFHPGMNVLVGRNGSGKSTVLNTLFYLMSGTDRLPGDKKARVCDYAPPEERSLADLHFEHNGSVLNVVRALRPKDSWTLRIDGGKAVVGLKSVQEELSRFIAATPSQLADFVFVEQKKLDGFLEKAPTERAKELASLVGLTEAEAVHKKIGDFLSNLPPVPPPADEDGPLQQIQQTQVKIQQLSEALERMLPLQDLNKHLREAATAVARAERRPVVAEELYNKTFEHQQLQAEHAALSNADPNENRDENLFREYLTNLRIEFEAAQATLTQWRDYRQAQQARTGLLEQLRRQIQLCATRPKFPVRPAGYLDVTGEEFREQMQELQQEIGAVTSMLNALNSLEPGQPCPMCNQPAPSLQVKRAEYRDKSSKLSERWQSLQGQMKVSQAFDTQLASAKQWRRHQRGIIRSSKRNYRSLPQVAEPSLSEVGAQKMLQDYETVGEQLRLLLVNRNQRLAKLETIDVQLKMLGASIAKLRAELADLGPDTESVAVVMTAQQSWQRRLENRNQLEGELTSARSLLQSLQTQYASAQRANQARAGAAGLVERIQRVRLAYHPTELPREMVYDRLKEMLPVIDSTLAQFNAPFRVSVSDKLVCTAHFLDRASSQPDQMLSVGQKTILALAIRVALNSTFSGHLGLLSLDEPTAALDDENASCLPDVLSQLKRVSASRALQVLIVTHDSQLVDLFDKVIRIQT